MHGFRHFIDGDGQELVYQEESGVTVHQGPSWEVGPSAARALKLQLSALKYFNYSSMVWHGLLKSIYF